MKKPIIAVILVCIVEAAMRFSYKKIGLDPINYTLIARLIQAGIIIGFAFEHSGMKTKNIMKEIIIGLIISIAFGVLVLSCDILSRIAIPGGLISRLLMKQLFSNFLMFALVGCIVGPFVEELFFRGLIQTHIRHYLPAIFAIAISSVFFATMHGNISIIQLSGGIMFGIIYEWRRNIWAAYVFHVIANFGILLCPFLWPIIISRIL
jgi:membrane protease YdiL (CAAX protease family)